MVFLSIDMAGGVFSLLSLVFRDTFDATASITYICVVVRVFAVAGHLYG